MTSATVDVFARKTPDGGAQAGISVPTGAGLIRVNSEIPRSAVDSLREWACDFVDLCRRGYGVETRVNREGVGFLPVMAAMASYFYGKAREAGATGQAMSSGSMYDPAVTGKNMPPLGLNPMFVSGVDSHHGVPTWVSQPPKIIRAVMSGYGPATPADTGDWTNWPEGQQAAALRVQEYRATGTVVTPWPGATYVPQQVRANAARGQVEARIAQQQRARVSGDTIVNAISPQAGGTAQFPAADTLTELNRVRAQGSYPHDLFWEYDLDTDEVGDWLPPVSARTDGMQSMSGYSAEQRGKLQADRRDRIARRDAGQDALALQVEAGVRSRREAEAIARQLQNASQSGVLGTQLAPSLVSSLSPSDPVAQLVGLLVALHAMQVARQSGQWVSGTRSRVGQDNALGGFLSGLGGILGAGYGQGQQGGQSGQQGGQSGAAGGGFGGQSPSGLGGSLGQLGSSLLGTALGKAGAAQGQGQGSTGDYGGALSSLGTFGQGLLSGQNPQGNAQGAASSLGALLGSLTSQGGQQGATGQPGLGGLLGALGGIGAGQSATGQPGLGGLLGALQGTFSGLASGQGQSGAMGQLLPQIQQALGGMLGSAAQGGGLGSAAQGLGGLLGSPGISQVLQSALGQGSMGTSSADLARVIAGTGALSQALGAIQGQSAVIQPEIPALLRTALSVMDAQAGQLVGDPAAVAAIARARRSTERRVAKALNIAQSLLDLSA